MPLDLENDTTFADALAKLEAAEADQSQPAREHFVQADPDARAAMEDGTPSPAAGEQPGQTPEAKANPEPAKEIESDTRAGAEQPPAGDTAGQKKPEGSQFAKDAKRRDESWKALNAEKEQFKTEREAFARERERLTQERAQLESQRAKSASKYTPEQYEEAAKRNAAEADQLELQARGLESQVREFEDDGKYTEAESAKARAKDLRERAAFAKGTARQLTEFAQQKRANPDPTLEQIKAKSAAAIRDFTIKAAQEWPDLLKDGSAFQQAVAKNIQEARAAGLDENEFPVVRYQAARMAALAAASARVPGLEKSLAEATARVKELEALTTPGGGKPSVQQQPARRPLTDEEEFEALRAEANGR